MATAQELFALTNGTEEHIVIGADRFITVPKPLQRIAVQFDHDIETVTFDCPRYWDDLDMSNMTVYINYKLPDGTLDAYPAKNIKAESNIMHFDWTISRNLTQYKGTITFLVCIKKTGTDGVEVNHWNSELCTDMYVSEGMECEEQAQMEYSELITQLLERMTVVENINVQADMMQTLHDETLEAASFARDESNYIKNSYANAYKQSVSGEVIRVDDVSPCEHTVDVRVHGNNFIDPSTIHIARYGKNIAGASNIDGVFTYDSTTGRYTISGTGGRSIYTLPVPIPKGTTCTITVDCISGIISNKSSNSAVIGGYHTSDSGNSWQVMVSFPIGESVNLEGTKLTNTITISETVTDIYFFFYDSNVTIISPIVCRIQFEIGEKTTDYVVHQEAKIYTPNTDGTVENIYSLYPTMTLFTDTNDTIIDLTYNRDNNKVIGDISTALDTLIAMQEDTIMLLNNMSGGAS